MAEEIHHNFQFYIKDVRFHYGGVSFRHFVNTLNKRLEFTIINYNIREEFDSVKEYFINIFNSKKIDVSAIITKLDNGNYIISAHSAQIESIDEKVMKAVRLEWARKITSKSILIPSKTTPLAMDNLFDSLENQDLGFSFLYSNEQDLIDDIITVSKSRHYNHLRYLSGKHLYQLMRLRFILKPFSFLFLLEGSSEYLLVWETLDTEEATYIWPIQKNKQSLKLALEDLQGIFSIIKMQGKQAYVRSSGDNFIRIIHQYTKPLNGFVLWKDELESHL
jgi:hypothetical protein